MNPVYEKALEIQKHKFKVFPMVDNRPAIKHPKENATLDNSVARAWWQNGRFQNIGVLLEGTGVLMLDVDVNHKSGADGMATLRKHVDLSIKGSLDTYYESSPSGGVHFFFSYDPSLKLTEATNLFADHDENGKMIPSGVDYDAVFVPVAPSHYRDGDCIACDGKTWADIAPAPQWLMDEILPKKTVAFPSGFGASMGFYRSKGQLFNKIAEGATQGGRHTWAVSVTGSLFHRGTTYEHVYDLMHMFNAGFVQPPLPDGEIDSVVNSIAKKELRNGR